MNWSDTNEAYYNESYQRTVVSVFPFLFLMPWCPMKRSEEVKGMCIFLTQVSSPSSEPLDQRFDTFSLPFPLQLTSSVCSCTDFIKCLSPYSLLPQLSAASTTAPAPLPSHLSARPPLHPTVLWLSVNEHPCCHPPILKGTATPVQLQLLLSRFP